MASVGSREALPQAADAKYSARVVQDMLGVRVVFKGTISTPNPSTVLNPFVDATHAYAIEKKARELRVDLTELEFCNSSGFKSFIHWIEQIQELPEAQRYKLRFLSTDERRWQRATLLALSCYGLHIVEIEGM
jgi:hypothetical protein